MNSSGRIMKRADDSKNSYYETTEINTMFSKKYSINRFSLSDFKKKTLFLKKEQTIKDFLHAKI